MSLQMVPCPSAGDIPFHEPLTATLQPGQRFVATFTPEQHDGTFYAPTLAISKEPETEYRAKIDGEVVYGPAARPPTDPDDFGVTFTPALQMEQQAQVFVTNLSGSTAQTYTVKLVGWEEVT